MQQYLDLVERVLRTGTHKPNRTGVDTLSSFAEGYEVDLAEGFPLLTTKDLSGFRWNSLIHEFLWYLSGEQHIRTLREETGIWNAWADEEGNLDTAYGRFWRRYPIPDEGLPGETWAEEGHRWVNDDERTFDQIQYVLDMLRENPNSRRIVVNAWHPANATVSTLPPCHYTFIFNVQGDRLNLQLVQRSGDIALGVPFNVAAYSLLLTAVAQRTGFEPGTFAHTVTDAHVYCGSGDRGAWYGEHGDDLADRLADVTERAEYREVADWVEREAPPEADDEEDMDHVPGLLRQLSREPRERPLIEVADKPLEELTYDDVRLREYDPAEGIRFAVAE
ncbi:thymidylate synthase [Halorarum halophilum]|uniref:Thymidylate synthase n=1 Tax=Halorarum halophilum TaxID=2743090 RepID=A0A7D5GDV3_9EURY|nr:thymidylate synthase [Halobaculum halophilum]QLG26928.1 thymidylate synthase [Halobaculum halophilum]